MSTVGACHLRAAPSRLLSTTGHHFHPTDKEDTALNILRRTDSNCMESQEDNRYDVLRAINNTRSPGLQATEHLKDNKIHISKRRENEYTNRKRTGNIKQSFHPNGIHMVDQKPLKTSKVHNTHSYESLTQCDHQRTMYTLVYL